MKKKIKSIKVKLYHKLINNKLIYDNKPLNRYNNNVNKISNMSSNKKENFVVTIIARKTYSILLTY